MRFFVHNCWASCVYRFAVSLCLLFCILGFASCEQSNSPLPTRGPELRGLSYTSFGQSDFSRGSSLQALSDARQQTSADFIALNVFVYQDSETTTSIYPTLQTSTDADIRVAVSDARQQNMRVLLKVNVDVLHGRWRGYITPDVSGLWFASYTSTMLHYISLANELNIELFSVGCELIVATQPKYTSQWRTLIATLRPRYNGELVYCANWNGIGDLGLNDPEYSQIQFWDQLDNIGVDMYQPLAQSASEQPSLSTAVARLQGSVDNIHALALRFQRPLIITETGVQSVRGALVAPYDFSRGSDPRAQHDEYSQNMFYEAMMSAFGRQTWCRGIFWWNWESVESPNAYQNYTPRNKQAAVTLKSWYNLSS